MDELADKQMPENSSFGQVLLLCSPVELRKLTFYFLYSLVFSLDYLLTIVNVSLYSNSLEQCPPVHLGPEMEKIAQWAMITHLSSVMHI